MSYVNGLPAILSFIALYVTHPIGSNTIPKRKRVNQILYLTISNLLFTGLVRILMLVKHNRFTKYIKTPLKKDF